MRGRPTRFGREMRAWRAAIEVAVPAQHGLRTHQQPDLVQHVAGEAVQQRSQQRPVGRSEPDLLAVQLPFQDRDLVAQGQDLDVLGPVAHRQQPQHRQPVGHGEVRQSKQHSKASSPNGRQRRHTQRKAGPHRILLQ